MVSHRFFYQLRVLGLLWLCVMLHSAWPNACTGGDQKPSEPLPPPCKRSSDPKPFPGLTRTPLCAACEQAHEPIAQPPGCLAPPSRADAGTAAPSGHRGACLPASALGLSGLGRARQYQCPGASQWWPLAAAAWHER
jgi:hypothetical protein